MSRKSNYTILTTAVPYRGYIIADIPHTKRYSTMYLAGFSERPNDDGDFREYPLWTKKQTEAMFYSDPKVAERRIENLKMDDAKFAAREKTAMKRLAEKRAKRTAKKRAKALISLFCHNPS